MAKSQKILEYPAIFTPNADGGYDVSFPAFPGCVTFGKNFEEARVMAAEILELWLEELSAQKKKIPTYPNRPIIDAIRVSLPVNCKTIYAANNF